MANEPSTGSFDAAALAVATAAGAISVFIAPGPYDQVDAVIGVTLLVIIWAYETTRSRTLLQSLAVSMSTGFISLLLLGLYREWAIDRQLRGICPIPGEPVYELTCPKHAESAVEPSWLFWAWVIVTVIVFVLDGTFQETRKRRLEASRS